MPTLVLLYLLKANFMLLLFAVAYFGLLRRLTFFALNRAYLAFALLFSAVYPALPVPALLPAVAVAPALVLPTAATVASLTHTAVAAVPAFDWAAVGLGLYAAGAAGLLGWLLVQLVALGRVRRLSRPATVQGVPVRTLAGAAQPFSFGQTIYLNPAQHPVPELAAVLRHELVHVRQWHTLDVLLAQLALALAWCNPAAWLLRRAVLDNLEFLADHAVLQTGLDRRDYQYSLVRLSHGPAGPALVSHFTFFTLKNRVAMMNTPLSSTGQLARYLVAGPLLLGLALGWSAARAQDGGPAPTATPVSAAARHTNALFFLDGQPSDEATVYQLKGRFVADVDVIDGEHLRRMFGAVPEKAAVVVTTKGHTGLPAVLALNDRIARSAPKAAPADQLPAIQVAKHGEQNAPTAVPAPPRPAAPQQSRPVVYYLDGQRQANPDFATSIVPATIASIDMIKDERAQELLGADAGQNVVIATTKANQHRADVEAFNKRIGVGVPPTAPVAAPTPRVAYLAAPALAYITTHYPNARLLSVAEAPAATDGAGPRYQAEIVVGRRPAYLLFDAQGRFLAESFTSSAR